MSLLGLSFSQVVEWGSWKVVTEGLAVDVMSLTTKRGISAMMSVHASTAARNAILSSVLHVMLGQ